MHNFSIDFRNKLKSEDSSGKNPENTLKFSVNFDSLFSHLILFTIGFGALKPGKGSATAFSK
jgi:hypothetical protein